MATDKGLEDIEQSQIESNYDETVDSFDEMSLRSELLRGTLRRPHIHADTVANPVKANTTFITGVYAYGFERPSAIQQRAIMPVIKGMYLCLYYFHIHDVHDSVLMPA